MSQHFTVYKTILNDNENLELSTIKFNGKWLKEVSLTFNPFKKDGKDMELWDNTKYLVKLLEELKTKRKGKRIKELKSLCKDYGYDFEEIRQDFIDMMKEAKIEKMWKK